MKVKVSKQKKSGITKIYFHEPLDWLKLGSKVDVQMSDWDSQVIIRKEGNKTVHSSGPINSQITCVELGKKVAGYAKYASLSSREAKTHLNGESLTVFLPSAQPVSQHHDEIALKVANDEIKELKQKLTKTVASYSKQVTDFGNQNKKLVNDLKELEEKLQTAKARIKELEETNKLLYDDSFQHHNDMENMKLAMYKLLQAQMGDA